MSQFKETAVSMVLDAPVSHANLHQVIMSLVANGNLLKTSPRNDASILFKIQERKKTAVDGAKKEILNITIRHRESIVITSRARNIVVTDSYALKNNLFTPDYSALSNVSTGASKSANNVLTFECSMSALYTPMQDLSDKEKQALEFLGVSSVRKVSTRTPVSIPDSQLEEKIYERFAYRGVELMENSVKISRRYNHGVKGGRKSMPAVTFSARVDVSDAKAKENFAQVLCDGIGKGKNYGLGFIELI